MRNYLSSPILFILFLFLPVCKEKVVDSQKELLPGLLNNKSSSYTEPGSTTTETYNNTDTVITLGTYTQSVTGCSPAEGQVVTVCLVSMENVDRYKSLEIVFSSGMQKKSVKDAFSLVSLDSGAIPTPTGMDLDDSDIIDKGGRFTWLSGRRLIFDPYRELRPNETYSLTIANTARIATGNTIPTYSMTFKTEHDFIINHSINSTSLGGNTDLTFNKSANLILSSSFANPTGAFTYIQRITLHRMGTTAVHEVCNGSCSNLPAGFNLNSSGVPPVEGGNSYFYTIQTRDNKIYKRYFAFNWGEVTNASSLIAGNSTGVLDEGIMMKLLAQMIGRFTKGDFKLKDSGVNKTFNDFMSQPTTTTKRTSHCIDYGSFTFIRTYGDSGTANGDGYCGAAGANPGGFVGNACFLGCSDFDMDVYITSVSIPGLTSGNQTVEAQLTANSTDELGVRLLGRKAFINLAVVARNRSGIALGLVGGGSRFYFTTTVELNQSPTPTALRSALAKSILSVNGTGNIELNIKPFTVGSVNDPNFTIQEWDSHIAVGGLNLVVSTSWVADILAPITEMIGNSMVPQVRPRIVHSMLNDIVEKVAPNMLNSVVGSLQTPGVDIRLPGYLPAPLSNFPLNVKLKLQPDAQVRVSGANKAIVSSADLGITYTGSAPSGGYRTQSRETGIVSFKPVGMLDNSYPFSIIGANPGMLLSLHTDAITQAAYHLWRARAIDLNMNEAFIDQINTYAGSSDLFKLAKTLMQSGPIISIIAPGRNTLNGVRLGPVSRLPPISESDPITFVLEPIQAPVVARIPQTGFAVPRLRVNLTDLQLSIVGLRTSTPEYPCTVGIISSRDTVGNCYYTLSVVRVSLNAVASFGFSTFSNPTANPTLNNLNSINIQVDPSSDFYYSLEVREVSSLNPYGLDPEAIRSVVDPLVKTLVVPLVNNILKEVPLPSKLDFPGLVDKSAGSSGGTSCKLNVQTSAIKITPLPTTASEPYVLNRLEAIGGFITNPGNLLECP
jgi:hypothetical protein